MSIAQRHRDMPLKRRLSGVGLVASYTLFPPALTALVFAFTLDWLQWRGAVAISAIVFAVLYLIINVFPVPTPFEVDRLARDPEESTTSRCKKTEEGIKEGFDYTLFQDREDMETVYITKQDNAWIGLGHLPVSTFVKAVRTLDQDMLDVSDRTIEDDTNYLFAVEYEEDGNSKIKKCSRTTNYNFPVTIIDTQKYQEAPFAPSAA